MRPSTLLKNTTLPWVLRTYNTSGVLTDADSTPTVAVRKNGSSTGDSVTVTKRASTTGIYDCSYNPASEVEGDQFTIEETATVGGTTESWNWSFTVIDSDITGKVLGGGAGTITGVGTHSLDGDGEAVAKAATALSNATWTSALASAILTAAKAVLAQSVVDTGATPWQEVLIEQGTGGLGVGTELRRLDLKETDGTAITSTDQVVGQKVDAA